jgi:Tol biopolymer transport system component
VVGGSKEILRIRLSDGAERAVTATPERDESWPYWSASAGRLVFQVSSDDERSDLVLWSPEGEERRLTRTPRRDERWPAWSPVDDRLAYAFRGGQPGAGLVVVDVETGTRRELPSPPPNQLFRPAFSPDGQSLVMQRRGADGDSSLWLASGGTAPTPLVDDARWFDFKPVFSRDGQRIFFSRRPAGGGAHDVMSVSLDGGDLRSHASLPDADDHSARPSPVRDELVFVSDRSGHPEVYLAELPDGAPRRLSPEGRAAFAPRWSPDGELVVAVHHDVTAPQPRLADPAGLANTRVLVVDRSGRVLLDAAGLMPDWMPAWP